MRYRFINPAFMYEGRVVVKPLGDYVLPCTGQSVFRSFLSDQDSEGLSLRFFSFFLSKIGNSQIPDCWSTHPLPTSWTKGELPHHHLHSLPASVCSSWQVQTFTQIWSLSGGGSFISHSTDMDTSPDTCTKRSPSFKSTMVSQYVWRPSTVT